MTLFLGQSCGEGLGCHSETEFMAEPVCCSGAAAAVVLIWA